MSATRPPDEPDYVPDPDPAGEIARPAPPRGRGAVANPPNRFVPLEVEFDPEEDGDRRPETRFYRDRTKSIISTNQSPDVGFSASVNPYRGCEHGCAYCLDGETLILMGDGRARPLHELKAGDEVYGTERHGHYRRYVKTTVLDHWSTETSSYRVVLEDGTTLIASGDHRFLTERGWKHVRPLIGGNPGRSYLTPNNKLMGLGSLPFKSAAQESCEYRRGYLCGMIRGDGHLRTYRYDRPGRANGDQHGFRLALSDPEALMRTKRYLEACNIPTRLFSFAPASETRRPIEAIRTSRRDHVQRIGELINWSDSEPREWERGFLAGIFDAEGSWQHGIFRICNTNQQIIDTTTRSLQGSGFRYVLESRRLDQGRPVHVVRLLGGVAESLRFFQYTDPAIPRKRGIEGHRIKSRSRLKVKSVEPLDSSTRLYDITTGTGDFIANGVVSHNCYARPYHEYLGLSAGLDFETKIWVKEDAPRLLARELASPTWTPQVLGISGVTDPYQPVEKKLGITRRILEVLLEYRNPVAVITKNHLVTRDADLLAGLARFGAAAVFVSIPTLDEELRRRMEPRTSSPTRRLDAIRFLADRGIPVGVLVAPVIPGLTEPEIPAILAAAAAAGATTAGRTVLRLPHQVAPLFEAWLAEHYPDRKDKVLNRVRSLRGGALNDPRFGSRMRGEGFYAGEIATLFRLSARRAGLRSRRLDLSTEAFRVPGGAQGELFPSEAPPRHAPPQERPDPADN